MTGNQAFNISTIDIKGLAKELDSLKEEELQRIGQADLRHLKKVDWTLKIFLWFGIVSSAWAINPLSPLLICIAKTGRWAMLGHHIGHGGYNKISDVPAKYTSL